MKTTNTISLLTALLATGTTVTAVTAVTASPDPGLFGHIQSDFDAAKSSVKDTWSSVKSSHGASSKTAFSTTTTTSSSSTSTSTAYPGCASSSSKSWCGVAIGGQSDPKETDSTPASYNVTTTDSRCAQVASRTGVRADRSVSLNSSVGRWEFSVYDGTGLDMAYEGRNISDFKKWDSWGLQYLNYTEGRVLMYGRIANCTSADKAKKGCKKEAKGGDKDGAAARVSGSVWALVAALAALTAML